MNSDHPEKTQDEERLAAALNLLREHFDSVAIFATRHEASEDGTVRMFEQCGNLYANLGWVQEWLRAQHCITNARAVAHDRQRQQEEQGE